MSRTTPNFRPFADAINKTLTDFASRAGNDDIHGIYEVPLDKDEMWNHYLDKAFSPEDNPIFRVRRVYDCSNDRNFIRSRGALIFVEAGAGGTNPKVRTIWADAIDNQDVDPVLRNAASKMDSYVRNALSSAGEAGNLPKPFVTSPSLASTGSSVMYEHPKDEKAEAIRFDGLHHSIDRNNRTLVRSAPDEYRGRLLSTIEVYKRGLETISESALESVLELIEQDNLYRGESHVSSVKSFREQKAAYDQLSTPLSRALFALATRPNTIRNTVIGTLLVDLSEGKPVEDAVRSYEVKVAPSNYRRPKALITPRMRDEALKAITDLGLSDSLERRQASLHDVNTSDVLWADSATLWNDRGERLKTNTRLADVLDSAVAESGSAKKASRTAKAVGSGTAVSYDRFVKEIIPYSKKVEALIESDTLSHLVTLTAPVNKEGKPIFLWDNGFAWSYRGDLAASEVANRVVKYGGKVATGEKLRFSLFWHCPDDLDLHCKTPDGKHIYYGERYGTLDLDMNGIDKHSDTDPVENMVFDRLVDGMYRFYTNNFSFRPLRGVGAKRGFGYEIAFGGRIMRFTMPEEFHPKDGRDAGKVSIAVRDGKVASVYAGEHLVEVSTSVWGLEPDTLWGLEPDTFVPVSSIMFSPNHWEGEKGHGDRHLFLMLKGCTNPSPVRGFYNEFLRPEYVSKHRRAFEVLADRMKSPFSEEQLSGIGFSTTLPNTHVTVKVDGKLYKVTFG